MLLIYRECNGPVATAIHGIGTAGDNANPNGSGTASPKHITRAVTITLYNLQNTQVAQGQGTVSFNIDAGIFKGIVSTQLLPSGDYQIKVQTDGLLTKRLPSVVHITSGQITTIPLFSFVTGDIDNNNQLDILDYNQIVNCFGSKQKSASCTKPPTQLSTGADIDDDGTIGGADYNLFLREISVQPGG